MGGSPAGDRRHPIETAESESHRQTVIGTQEDQGLWQKASTGQQEKNGTCQERQSVGKGSWKTKLDFEQCTRDATLKRTRSDTGDSPGNTSMNGKHARLTDTGEAGDTMQNPTSEPS